VEKLLPKVLSFIGLVTKIGPAVLIVYGTFKTLAGVVGIIRGIKDAVKTVNFVMTTTNAILAANPAGIIIAAVGLLIAGFMILTKKVGGLVPALQVVFEYPE
jgi:hypothetical protein